MQSKIGVHIIHRRALYKGKYGNGDDENDEENDYNNPSDKLLLNFGAKFQC